MSALFKLTFLIVVRNIKYIDLYNDALKKKK